ncbi:MAG: PIN domain-containing protein [Spirochaetota bacterium]|nr:PIN domain-containing protein [Spirochaetota bacterium]
MKNKLFIDTDVILDVALRRHPYYINSALVLSLIELKEFHGFTSTVIITNLYYILRKLESHDIAVEFIKKLRLIIDVLAVDDEIINLALESKFKDFEDAIQYYTALKNGVKYIITRNTKDYSSGNIIVCTPDEFVTIIETKHKE